MKLNLADFKQYCRGTVRGEINSEGDLLLKRMTAGLEEFYSYNPGALARAKSMAGIRVVFISDTTQLKLTVKYGTPVRNFFKLFCYIDGQLQADGPDEFQPEAEICFNAQQPGRKLFELHLPHCCEILISSCELINATTIQPAPFEKMTWLLIGDSITQGMTATGSIFTFSTLTAKELGINQHNIAVGGAVLQGKLGELVKDIDCDLITVAFGTNDFNQSRDLDEFYCETIKLLRELLKKENCQIALLTTIPWPERTAPNELGLNIEDYRQQLRKAAAEFPTVTLIEGPDLIPEDSDMFVDNIHPNNQGMEVYATNLTKELSKLLSSIQE